MQKKHLHIYLVKLHDKAMNFLGGFQNHVFIYNYN